MLYGNKQYKPYAPLYPTPDDIPLETTCVTISIPSNPAWIGLWIAALMVLCDPENFQEFQGGISRETTAEIFHDALIDALTGEISCELSEPYWDDPEGDDAASGEENPDFPFYEDVANFAIAGFVLYATGSPAAALQYWTVARQFRLKFRKNPLGGLVKIILDGSLIGEVDTYAETPSIVDFDVISPGTTLRLEFPTEGTVTQVIRKQLWEGEITGNGVRWNDDCECFQTYNPATDTWEENPQADPRTGIVYLLPPRGGSDPRCDAAANIRAKFEAIVDSYLTAVSIVEAIAAIGAIISVFAPGPGLFAALIIALVNALVAIGNAAIVLAMTESAYEQFQCIVYDEIDSNGQVSQAAKDEIYSRVQAEMSPVQFAVISLIINFLGEVGMSNAGATGGETGDCSACGCPEEIDIDFTNTALYGIVSGVQDGNSVRNGVAGNIASIVIRVPVDGCIVEGVSVTWSNGTRSDATTSLGYGIYENDGTPIYETGADEVNFGVFTKSYGGSATPAGYIQVSYAWNMIYFGGGSAYCTHITVTLSNPP